MTKLGFIGTGKHGGVVIKDALSLSIPISCVYGHANRADLSGHVDFVESVDDVIAGSDAVVVNTPPVATAEIGMKCIFAGKPCLLSKPVATSSGQARRLLALSQGKGVPVMAGHSLCYSSGLRGYFDHEYRAALVHHSRPPSTGKMNIYWNIGIHFVALFDVLGINNYAIELLMCDGVPYTREIRLLSARHGWLDLGISGDIYKDELAHFCDCVSGGKEFLTDITHAVRVVDILEKRYGAIDILRG